MVFIHAGGDFVEFTLAPGEASRSRPAALWPSTSRCSYDIQFVGGIKMAIFGGEGLFLATLTGPGRVVLQSMTLQKMRRELAPHRRGGEEHHGLTR